MPKVIGVIVTSVCRGAGTEEDPCRSVPQLFTLDGRFICEAEHLYNGKMDGTGHFQQNVNFEVLNRLQFE